MLWGQPRNATFCAIKPLGSLMMTPSASRRINPSLENRSKGAERSSLPSHCSRSCKILLTTAVLSGLILSNDHMALHIVNIQPNILINELRIDISPTAALRYDNLFYSAPIGGLANDRPTHSLHSEAVLDLLALHSEPVLDLLPWELQSLHEYSNLSQPNGYRVVRVCRPPKGISEMCCLGSVSARGRMTRRAADRCFTGDGPYNKVARAARLELQRTAAMVKNSDECDVCRIMNIIYKLDLRFGFTGDSTMLQTFTGLQCELARRGYQVVENTTYYHENYVGVRSVTTLEISGPTHWIKPVRATYLSQYMPLPDMSELKQIASTYNVLVMNFGLHWSWGRRKRYLARITDILNATKHGKSVQLLAFIETSAQHFNGLAGEFGAASNSCVPWPEESMTSPQFRWREQAVHEKAAMVGLHVIVADETLPSAGRVEADQKELIILPYNNFTRFLHDLHPDECTHYCSTPFLWIPIWRSLRLAMDRQWNIT